MAAVQTTGLSDYETDQSSTYSDDIDLEYTEQTQSRISDKEVHVAGGDDVREHDNSHIFPSLASINLRFLFGSPDGTSVTMEQDWIKYMYLPRFRMTPLRRTGEVELQIENSKEIEIGLERCRYILHQGRYEGQHLTKINPTVESSCTFFVCGVVFDYLKHNSSVNLNYPQKKYLLSQNVSRIGLKITRDGALEFFFEWPEPRNSSRSSL